MSALTGDSLHLVEVPRRWRVYRLRSVRQLFQPWIAVQSSPYPKFDPRRANVNVLWSGKAFCSWREAFDYADRMSR